MSRFLTALVLAVGVSLSVLPMAASGQALADYSVAGGHFYSQANGTNQGPDGGGFAITNDQGIPFWTFYDQHGGVEQFGYPISRRFIWDGRITQVTQRAVFQWDPASSQVELANIFDYLAQAGKDDWLLTAHLAPKPQQTPNEFQPLPFLLLAHYRFVWLRDDPAFFHRYFSTPDYYAIYGLPTSSVQDLGPYTAMRFQRVVMYHWKSPVPWADSRGVSIGLAGDIFKQLGFVPTGAILPENASRTSAALPVTPATPPQAVTAKVSAPVTATQIAKSVVAAVSPTPVMMAAASTPSPVAIRGAQSARVTVVQPTRSVAPAVPSPTASPPPTAAPVQSTAVLAAASTRTLVAPSPSPTATPPARPAAPPVVHSFQSLVLDGVATWYGAAFHGRTMSNGHPFNMWDPTTAAANVFPLGTRLRVTRQVTGHSIIVTVTDHGAFSYPDLVDLSYAAFARLADPTTGVIGIQVVPVVDDGG